MSDFLHVIVTMFNVKTKPSYDDWPKDEKWVDNRIDLFEKYTYPSITKQKNTNFKWLLFCSNFGISDKSKERLNSLNKVEQVYIEGNEWFDYKIHLINYLMEKKDLSKYKYLITTTIDSDDIVRNNYVERIQSEFFAKQDLAIINFSLGYRYFMEDTLPWLFRWDCNSLFTMIEKVQDPEEMITCRRFYSHVKVCRKTYFKYVTNIKEGDPMWIQLIHNNNVQSGYRTGDRWNRLNSLGYKLKISSEDIQKNFNVNITFNKKKK